MKQLKIGILAYHGDVEEHLEAAKNAAKKLKQNIEVIPVRIKEDIINLAGLIIPGGESTTLYKLCQREGIFEQIKQVKNIFGTCAGAIMLAKTVDNKTPDQKTLELMDIEIDRNAYGRQNDSFETEIKTELGNIKAVFIRAPRIKSVGKNIKVLAKNQDEVIACEQRINGNYYLALCFHPELTTTIFHEYFIKKIAGTFNLILTLDS